MIKSKYHVSSILLALLFTSGMQAINQFIQAGIKRIKIEESDEHTKELGKILEDEVVDLDENLDKKLDQEYKIFEDEIAGDLDEDWTDNAPEPDRNIILQRRIENCLKWIQPRFKHIDISIKIANPDLPKVPNEMRNDNICTTGMTDCSIEKKASIYINRELNRYNAYEQYHTIFHELAHAVDPELRKPKYGIKNYSHIHKDILSVHKRIIAKDQKFKHIPKHQWKKSEPWCEWHADWQAIQWMKEFVPDHIKNWKWYLLEDEAAGLERDGAPIYPPNAQMLQWLS